MTTKQIVITSSGLKNIVLNKYQEEDDFIFIFGEKEVRMKSFFAEFISPIVSRIHQIDPTIHIINIGESNACNNEDINELAKTVLTPEIISLFIQISSGFSINITEEQAIKLRFLSILLGNDELHDKLNEHFPPNYNEENVNSYLKNIESCYHFSRFKFGFDFTSLLSFVSSHFYQLDKDEFLNQSRRLQYEIISHPNLQIESEDSLFDIVFEIIGKEKENEDEVENVLFLEQLEFSGLSEERLHRFVSVFDANEMSNLLWQKLSILFFKHRGKKSSRITNKMKSSIIVSGANDFNQLVANPNNKNEEGKLIISPPLNLWLDSSSFLSYSSFYRHSVLVKRDGSLYGIGNNRDGRISSLLAKTKLNEFTEFSIKDDNGNKLKAVSAVCCYFGTLYMVTKSSGIGRQLVYCDCELNGGNPVFLDIGNLEPVSLFGGCNHAAAICKNGEVLFFHHIAIKNSPKSRIAAVSLPGGEKALSVACCDNSVVVLGSSGRLFTSSIQHGNDKVQFSLVSELADEEIVCLSGTVDHFLAVSKEGRVFGRGSNDYGQLGLGEGTGQISTFTLISSLERFVIRAAYAGFCHSLFETVEGKILSCGHNGFGELLLSSGPGENIYFPKETTITSGATFCITGNCLNVVFTGIDPPPNSPNMRIKQIL